MAAGEPLDVLVRNSGEFPEGMSKNASKAREGGCGQHLENFIQKQRRSRTHGYDAVQEKIKTSEKKEKTPVRNRRRKKSSCGAAGRRGRMGTKQDLKRIENES